MMFCNLYVCVKICFNEITKLRVSSNKLLDFSHAKQIHLSSFKTVNEAKTILRNTQIHPTSKTMKSAAAIVALAASAAAFAPAPINTKSSALNTVWDD